VAWAVQEVDRSGARLVTIHICPPDSPLARVSGEPVPAVVEPYDAPLARAVSAARSRLGSDRVALRILNGDVAAGLIDASAGMEMLVIGAGASSRIARRVTRHSHGPVVVVPDLTRGTGGMFAGHVVVGVDGSAAGRTACEFAFGYADKHGVPLAAAYVSEQDDDDYFYDETTLSTHFTVEPAALELLATEVEPWSLKYPRIRLRRAVLHGAVADGLVRAAPGALLLVAGDKRRGPLSRTRTGDVPLALIRRVACPTAIVPVDPWVGETR
jgi:nucleotide-binding universal stress UspA family protein